MKQKLRAGLLLLFALFFLLQFWKQPELDIKEQLAEADFLNAHHELAPETIQFLKQACYDCHSLNTRIPWYGKVEPVGGWLRSHIKHGREIINFSDWGNKPLRQQIDDLDFVIHEIETGDMPLPSYMWMHPEARLEKKKEARVLADLRMLLEKYKDTE